MSSIDATQPTNPSAANDPVGPLDAIRLLRSAGKALFVQAGLHAQLAGIEWQEEKQRLTKMAGVALLGFASTLGAMVFASGLAMAFSWDTPYRVPTAIGVVTVYALMIVIAWHRFQSLSAMGSQAFASTRAELVTDIAMLRSRL
jgi:uncharacterized membrane protein YqjE